MLLGVTSPVIVIAPRIGSARDAKERMQKWSKGIELPFVSWNVAAMHTFDFNFPDAWSRKKIKTFPPMYGIRYTHRKWPGEAKEVLLGFSRECRGGIYMTVDELAPHGDESVEFLVNDELFYHAGVSIQ